MYCAFARRAYRNLLYLFLEYIFIVFIKYTVYESCLETNFTIFITYIYDKYFPNPYINYNKNINRIH